MTPTLTLANVHEGDKLPVLRCDVTTTLIVLGAIASRDWRPLHHDYHFAVDRAGTRDIFMNTPNLAAWFERYLTDWTGPFGRLGRMTFRMRSSIFPNSEMEFAGTVRSVHTDDVGTGWVGVDVQVHQEGQLRTSAEVHIAIPVGADDNPWRRRGAEWCP